MKRPRVSALINLVVPVLMVCTVMDLAAQTGGRRGPGAGASGRVATVELGERSHTISVAGRLEPRSRIVHRIPAAGYVLLIAVREGQRVSEGEELLRVRRSDDVLEIYQPVPLLARVSGRVASIAVDVESEVTSGAEAVTIIGTDGFRLAAWVSDKDAFRVGLGQSVSAVTTEGERVAGVLETRSQEPDYETGLFELIFRFPSAPEIRIGEFLMIELPVDLVEGVFVPRDALVRRYGAYYIWVVTEDDTLEAREVSVGDTFGEEVYLPEGVVAGERYLPAPSGREREGAAAGGVASGSP